MSHIDELIAKLAPAGVLYRELGEVATYSTTRVSASLVDSESFVGVDNLLPNQRGRTASGYVPTEGNLAQYLVGDVLIGNIRPYLKKIWLATEDGGCSPDVLAIRVREAHRASVDPRVLYWLLSSEAFFAYDMRHARGGKMPRGSKPMVLKYRVPVPPLEVQQEIVTILDSFTELEAQLEAELEAESEARGRQDAHYRRALLTFATDVPVCPLGEMADNLDYRRKPVTRAARTAGIFPYYGASGIVDYVSDFLFEGDYLLVSEDGANLLARSTPIAFSIAGKTWVNNHAHVLRFATYAERRFVEIYLNSIDLVPFITGAAQPKLSQGKLNTIPVPNPPLEEKERIVAIVDKLDALVKDLRVSLPAELTARRGQYEYYRDRLLTFGEVPA